MSVCVFIIISSAGRPGTVDSLARGRLRHGRRKTSNVATRCGDARGQRSTAEPLSDQGQKSGLIFLIDTGSDLSVLPKSCAEGSPHSASFKLYAANDTVIDTFGEKLLHLDFNLRRSFTWMFTVADVTRPILGADFLKHYGLWVDLKKKRLIDSITKLSSNGELLRIEHQSISTIAGDDATGTKLLREYTDITVPSKPRQLPALYQTTHHIVTKGPPIAERPRQLTPEKLRAAKTEFEYMVAQGIC